MKYLFTVVAACLLSFHLSAQDSTYSKWSVTPGIEMNMVPVIDPGKADSSGSSLSVAPYIKFQFYSGIGIKAQAYLLTSGPQPGYYMTSLSPFYSIDKKKISMDISYSHFFIKGNTAMLYTPITNELYASLTYKAGSVSPVGGVDIGFGTDTSNQANTSATDVNIFLGATHSFDWDLGATTSLNFSPRVLFNIGTDRYFEFLQSTGFITHGNNFKKIIKTNVHANGHRGNKTTTSLPSIAVNNLETSADLNFSIGHFSIEPEASLFIPFAADGEGVFGYWQIGISYKLGK